VVADDEVVDRGQLRVSDAEREHVLEVLKQALHRGMLDVGEFDERSATAARAQVRRELNGVLIDLPVRRLPERDDPAPAAADDVLEFNGWFSSMKRSGEWHVPPKIVLRPRAGSVELDFTAARIDHPRVEIELDVAGGSVELRLPENASASLDGVTATVGSVEDHRRGPDRQGTPHFALTGQVRWGSVEVRGPRRGLFSRR
jgi:hypothetical protein